ncbi:MAG: hypothetical protein RLZ98_28 [Pseudomonadota bacterium]|jgi:catechol 2,3-dioxygenase-like lactoylglutathione lyase family enzyme
MTDDKRPKLRHIAIVTVDPDRLGRFYCDVFGMEEVGRNASGGVFLTDGTINLAILKNKAEGKPNGLNHIGFQIDDQEAIEAKLADWNLAPPAQRPADRTYAEVRMTDPDGVNIDLSVNGFERVNVERRQRLMAKAD